MKHPTATERSAVDGVIGANLLFKDILKEISKINGHGKPSGLQKATNLGDAVWGFVTGESKNVNFGRHSRGKRDP